jgi:hypothetical protein
VEFIYISLKYDVIDPFFEKIIWANWFVKLIINWLNRWFSFSTIKGSSEDHCFINYILKYWGSLLRQLGIFRNKYWSRLRIPVYDNFLRSIPNLDLIKTIKIDVIEYRYCIWREQLTTKVIYFLVRLNIPLNNFHNFYGFLPLFKFLLWINF